MPARSNGLSVPNESNQLAGSTNTKSLEIARPSRLAFGIYDLTSGEDAGWLPGRTRLAYAFDNQFGPTLKCSGSGCLGELIFTTPFSAAVIIGIWPKSSRRKILHSDNPTQYKGTPLE